MLPSERFPIVIKNERFQGSVGMDVPSRRSVARLDADRDVWLHAPRAPRQNAGQAIPEGPAPHEAEAAQEREKRETMTTVAG